MSPVFYYPAFGFWSVVAWAALINFEPSLANNRYTTVYGSVNPACVLEGIEKLAIEIGGYLCYNAKITHVLVTSSLLNPALVYCFLGGS